MYKPFDTIQTKHQVPIRHFGPRLMSGDNAFGLRTIPGGQKPVNCCNSSIINASTHGLKPLLKGLEPRTITVTCPLFIGTQNISGLIP